MTAIDDLRDNNNRFAEGYDGGSLPAPPSLHVAVVTCMDARIDTYAVLGLRPGQAHVLRNAGGVVTDDVLRSLAISQRELGTTEVMVVHHTACGMLGLTEDGFKATLAAETGLKPSWSVESFSDLDADVRQSMARILASPFIPHKQVRGFVYDVATGAMREVDA